MLPNVHKENLPELPADTDCSNDCKVIAWADINFFLFPTSSFLFSRDNRIPIGDGIFIVGSLKNAGLRPELEDDVIAGLEVDSLNKVKFFTRLQVRGRIIHSKAYKRVSVRNSYTISYKDGSHLKYGQVEVFVQATNPQDSSVKYAAVLPFKNKVGFVCGTHKALRICPVTHIVSWHPPSNDQCVLIPINCIEDICICMDSKDTDRLQAIYIARFPNHVEKD